MPSATITSKGQVTIPKKIRDRLNLKSGDSVNFEIESDNRVIMISSKRKPGKLYKILYREVQKPLSVEEMDEGVAEYFRKKYKRE